MKKNYARTQKTFFTLLLAFAAISLNAQVSNYAFSQSSAAYTAISGGTLLGSTTSDDQRFVDPSIPLGGTTNTGVGFPIGFPFTYNGIVFDRFAINFNGWISLGQSALTPSVDINSTNNFNGSLASTFINTPTLLRNRIAGIGIDLQGQTGSGLRIQTMGTTPNQVCIIQWSGVRRYGVTGENLNYQIRLYETTNVVEVHFSTITFGTAVSVGTGAPEIGLGGTIPTDFNNRVTTTNWNSTTAGAQNNLGCDINTGVTYPASGTVFTWTPPNVCTGVPIGGTTASDINPVCDGQTFILSVNGASQSTGITYQWISSNDGINFVDVAGANLATLSATQSTTTYNRCIVTCTNSGLSDTSVVLQVNMKPANLCYCNSAAAFTSDTKIDSVEYLTVLTGSPAATCETYTDYTSQIATIQQTVPFSLRIRNGSCSGFHYGAYVGVYIDYNQNGLLTDPGELAYSFGPTTGLNTIPIANITIPLTASIGQTGMRIVFSEATLSGPCTAYDYGETEDYIINIAAAPSCVNPPVAGSISGATSTCSGNTVSLSLSGHSVGTSLQWETSTDNSSWSEVPGATTTSLTTTPVTDTVYYRVKVKCTDSVYTSTFEITLNPFLNCYCSTGIGGVCGVGEAEINNVNIPSTTLNNNSGCNTIGADVYTAYADTGVATATLLQSVTYTFNVNCSDPAIVSVWIDYNQNGIFEASEWTQITVNAQNATGTVIIPGTALLGQTGMRVRSRLQGNPNGATDACLNFGSGETEDYIITIGGTPTCTDPPSSGSITGAGTTCVGSTVALTLSGHTLGTSLQWETSPDGSSWSEVAGATNIFYTTPVITDTVYYRVKVRCTDSVYTAAFEITINPFYSCYCTPGTTDCSFDDVILNVTFAGINNTTTCSPNGYSSYSSPIGAAYQGASYPISVQVGPGGTEYVGVWIDYDQNGVFDSTEFTAIGSANGATIFNNITIPLGATSGITGMRVRVRYNTALTGADACTAYTFGETEDYLINISAAPVCTTPSVGGTATGPATGEVGPNYLYIVTGSTGDIQWQYSTTSVSGPFSDIGGANNDSLLANFNGPATFWIRAYVTSPGCDPDSSNVVETVITFTGDDVCDAVSLSLGVNGPFNTNSASVQSGEPAPPGNGCSLAGNWCNSIISNTLWFTFVAPASGRVSIQSPDFDTQLALWDANTCGDILTGGATLIAANDDDPDAAIHGGVSYSSFLDTVTCLIPGRTYYVQLDPYTSPGGSTTIVLTDLGGTNLPLSVSLNSKTDVTCFGYSDGTIDMNVSGGSGSYSYVWDSGDLTQDLSGLTGGTYTLIVSDLGCNSSVSSNPIVINEPLQLTASLDSLVDVRCYGESTGGLYITIIGGTAPFTFAWSDNSSGPNLTGVPAGLYTGTVTDANGCTLSSPPIPIGEPSAPLTLSLDSVTDNICAGGTTGAVYITVDGGTPNYTYNWSDGATTQDNTGLAANIYDVSVTDANGCTVTPVSGTVADGALVALTVDSVIDNACAGLTNGGVYISVSGGTPGYTYDWSDGATSEDNTGLAAGTYTVIAQDAVGCSATGSGTVADAAEVIVSVDSIINNPCAGGSAGAVYITASGGTPGYSFNWSDGATTEDNTGLVADIYDVTVQDAIGCTATTSGTVGDGATVTVTLDSSRNVTCHGLSNGFVSISVSGGVPSYHFNWSNNATTEDISGLGGGSYTVNVSDANGCTATLASVTITDPAILSVTLDSIHAVKCFGVSTGAAYTTISGGTAPTSVLWDNNATTDDISNLAAGTYVATVKDNNGCIATVSAAVTQPAVLFATYTHTNQIQGGALGSINVTISGGTSGYTSLWSNNATTEDLSNLTAGVYTCTITDANGCSVMIRDTVKLITGIGSIEHSIGVDLYPNPTQNQITLDLTLDVASDVSVDVYTISGQLVHQFAERNILTAKFEMNFANEASGVYYAKIKVGDTTLTKRIVVAK